MRPQHIAVFADILRADPQTLAHELHSVMSATEHEFSSDDARDAYADVIRALGRFQHASAFPRAFEAVAGETFRPLPRTARCSVCQSDDVVRDATARWDAEGGEWSLAGVLDDHSCETCGANGSTVADYEASAPDAGVRVRIAPRANHPDAGRTGTVLRPNHVRGGLYLRLDRRANEAVERVALADLDQIEIHVLTTLGRSATV
ncbi:hypothetical protein [Sphingomonas sp. TX0522]|uniref:hypothetical protein n=1 Tax=Sphingomonas sp. TX0522 TaxID=2479205 RepID=UPI0018DF57C6|nr:hypothetical protein [Sphingomonas sp. TX0522]MBI0533008.1 hypothetical protein [Sphingomonas sp. TX0522]